MEKKKILIVEDEGIIALDIKKGLESLGYLVSGIIDSGEKAIEEVKRIKPDLILMDIVLKGRINGMDASISIGKFLDIPVIYITSLFDQNYKDQCNCLKLKYDFLIKPFNPEDLRTKVEQALYQ